ncbi:hypothetical protein BKA93DRAFT_392382 [Sparassis latifolia]|uniref:DUF7598 domain-containing protein n=1 Tax=Sparassis crispa TaxID=139825 RepID=A0A401GXP2_9APHY|nr:hypothetical protein SCP_1002160 [Sparassis crispa]GBE86971.1 hypothetical protein SCP_1002160 [Sparassis crispa]
MANARYIFIGLNVVRALSIVALVLLFSSSIATLVQDIKAVNAFIAEGKPTGNSTQPACEVNPEYVPGSTVPNQAAGAFWAVLNRLLIIFQVIVLILSEVRWPAAFFSRFFPILGDEFGLGALGIIQGLLGASVLSHHVDEFSLVSAFFLFALACVNMLLGLLFRESAKARRSIRAWRGRNNDNGTQDLQGAPPFVRDMPGTSSDWADKEKDGADAVRSTSSSSARNGMGFGRQGEKAALARGETVTRPVEALPTYAPRPTATPTTAGRGFPIRSPRPMTESDVTAV